MQERTTLAEIATNEYCVITKMHGHGGFRHRLLEMGFIRGEKVKVIKNAPLSDPIEYEIMNNHVSLRRVEAAMIEVTSLGPETYQPCQSNEIPNLSLEVQEEMVNTKIRKESHTITVALVGNPNCGKTSLFNNATGLHEKVGNYSGVTIGSKVGTFRHKGYDIVMTDLPGTYSLTEYTPEESYVRDFLLTKRPDVILNIVDASNLERNMFLTTQLIDMNQPMIMALNMFDEFSKSGASLDMEQLSRLLGFPIVPTVSSRGRGVDKLLDRIIDIFENRMNACRHIHINYGDDIEMAIDSIKQYIQEGINKLPANVEQESVIFFPKRYLALKTLESETILDELNGLPNIDVIRQRADYWKKKLNKHFNDDTQNIIAEAKYSFIRGALRETVTEGDNKINKKSYSIDYILTNKWLGFPILFVFLWIMFQATFTLGAYPQKWIEIGVSALGNLMYGVLPQGILSDMIVDGIIAGVGGVIVFLPNILIMFFFISLLEDSGYMARAAFITDKLMHKIGLHGKSFIPYLIGFGCSVPAIMSTRTLASRKDRIITILTIPFVSCSARLPVYLLLVSAFFVDYQGFVLLSVYLVGIVVAICTAMLLRNTFFKNVNDQFVMELPPYRYPTLRNAMIHMWEKSVFYLKKMGTVILLASIIIWALGYFPRTNPDVLAIDNEISRVENMVGMDQSTQNDILSKLQVQRSAAHNEGSYIGRLGHFIEPIVAPLGFDWKMGVSILTGLGAKEIVVSSMGILYQFDTDGDTQSLAANLQKQRHTFGPNIGQPVITPLTAYSFMLFVLLYFPCIAALSAIRKEAGRRWMWLSVFYTISVAWIVSFLVTNIGGLFI